MGKIFFDPMPSQFEALRSTALWAWAPVAILLVGAVLARFTFNVSLFELTGDPASITGAPFYTGMLSNIGVLLWIAAGSICLFSFVVHRRLRGDPQ